MKFIFILIFLLNTHEAFAQAKGPFVLPKDLALQTQDQKIFIDSDEYYISKPNLIFQLGLNNKDNHRTVTITNLQLTVFNSVNEELIELRPNVDLYELSDDRFKYINRDYFFEVSSYQSTTCMDKVEYFKEPSYQRSCKSLGKDTLTILNYGVSALNAIESEDKKSCCPFEAANMQNLYIIVGNIKLTAGRKSASELGVNSLKTESLTATLRLQGFYGTFKNPQTNYDEKIELKINRL